MNEYSALVIGALTTIATVLGVMAQRRGKKEDTHLETSKWMRTEMKDDLKQARDDAHAAREEVEGLRKGRREMMDRIEVLERAVQKLRRDDGIQLLPMSDFVEDGWLAALNDAVANPEGVHVYIYLDDVDGDIGLGYGIIPADLVPEHGVPTAHRLRLRAARRVAAIERALGINDKGEQHGPHDGINAGESDKEDQGDGTYGA